MSSLCVIYIFFVMFIPTSYIYIYIIVPVLFHMPVPGGGVLYLQHVCCLSSLFHDQSYLCVHVTLLIFLSSLCVVLIV